MSRSEWWTIVILLGCILFVLILMLVYLRFIWDILEKIWNIAWRIAFDPDITKLYMGHGARGQYGQGPGGMLGSRRTDLPESDGDASPFGPGVR